MLYKLLLCLNGIGIIKACNTSTLTILLYLHTVKQYNLCFTERRAVNENAEVLTALL